jgi:hypothetical protein
MKVLRRIAPIVILLAAVFSIIFSHKRIVVEFNTGMPIQNTEGLRKALDKLTK